MGRRFFYVSAAVLCLAIAYQLGASAVGAQSPAVVQGISSTLDQSGLTYAMVVTENGDIYVSNDAGTTWQRRANCFAGSAPTRPDQGSFGGVKERYR
jgi:hypothetical protein